MTGRQHGRRSWTRRWASRSSTRAGRGLDFVAACFLGLCLLGCDSRPHEATTSESPEAPAARGIGGRLLEDAQQDGSRQAAQPSARAPREGRPKILAFGDSLTSGLGVPAHETYPAQLQQRLSQGGYHVRVINAGVSGETSAGGLRRVDWVLKSEPSLVILELGGNDGLRGIDPDQTRANLEAIIKKFEAADVPVLLVGMQLPPNYGGPFRKRFAALYAELAEQYGLPLVPLPLEDVAAREGLTQADGLHPTAAGYQVLVDRLLPVLEPMLSRIIDAPR